MDGYASGLVNTDLQVASTARGNGALALDFTWSVDGFTCAAAAIDRVHFFLTDQHDKLVAGSETTVPCGSLPASVLALHPGNYNVNVEGFRGAIRQNVGELSNVAVSPGATSRYVLPVR